MLQFLDNQVMWPNLKKLLKRLRDCNLVSVPYIGKGASDLLKLGQGVISLCALTERNARAGLVCPEEIARLQKRRVKAYIGGDLHAKVYLIGDRVVVGSANASQFSEGILDEAALTMIGIAGIQTEIQEK